MADRLNGMAVCSRCKRMFYPETAGCRVRLKEVSKDTRYYMFCSRCLKEFNKFAKKEI